MDYDGAISVLNEHKRLIEECGQTPWLTKERKAALERLNSHCQAVNAILGPLRLGPITATSLTWHRDSLHRINRAVELLTAGKMMSEVNALIGQPALPLGQLHPVVYKAARSLWDKGNYRHAVADAATSLSIFTQNRLRRHDVSDRDLMAQAFTDKDPERGKARLRCPGKRNSETTRSLQQGAQLFAMGVFQAIRNPAHHTTGDGEPVTAFEDLVALSKVARWVSEWYIDQYEEPIDLTQVVARTESQTTRKTPTS
jgi:hypothetical protein